MESIFENALRGTKMLAQTAALCALGTVGAAGTAQAAVLISAGATTNIVCASGVCTPTKKGAILNVTQLESLLASGNVRVTTAGSKSSDIVVSANLSWASAYSLTLDAYQSIRVDKAVSVNGTGGLTLTTDDGGTGGFLSFGEKGHVSFLSTANSLTINGATYTLVADTTTLASDVASNPSGNFALANEYKASSSAAYVMTTFNGNFQGLGNIIANLKIASSNYGVGLFAAVGSSGTVTNVMLTNVNIKAITGATAGALVGSNQGLLEGDSVSGQIKAQGPGHIGGLVGYNDGGSIVNSRSAVTLLVNDVRENDQAATVGGLVGYNNFGSVADSYATGNVSSLARDFNGGLVGLSQGGTISNSYATGSVTAGSGASVGGLMGWNSPAEGSGGIVTNSYSTGSVTAGSDSYVGGLIGTDGQEPAGMITDSYWDMTTSGITNPSQGAGNVSNDPGITGLSTTQLQAGLPSGFSSTIWGQSSSINGGLPYLLAVPPA